MTHRMSGFAAVASFLAAAVLVLLAVLVEPTLSEAQRYALLSVYGLVAGGVLALAWEATK